MSDLRARIEASTAGPIDEDAVREVIDRLDQGLLRVAEPGAEGWVVHAWVKQAILLYFKTQPMAVDQRPFGEPVDGCQDVVLGVLFVPFPFRLSVGTHHPDHSWCWRGAV